MGEHPRPCRALQLWLSQSSCLHYFKLAGGCSDDWDWCLAMDHSRWRVHILDPHLNPTWTTPADWQWLDSKCNHWRLGLSRPSFRLRTWSRICQWDTEWYTDPLTFKALVLRYALQKMVYLAPNIRETSPRFSASLCATSTSHRPHIPGQRPLTTPNFLSHAVRLRFAALSNPR